MSSEIERLVLDRAGRDGVDGAVAATVSAAFRGEAALEGALRGESGTEAAGDAQNGEAAAAGRVWLAGIGVAGFRGIAGRVDVALAPGPGLVVVCGRNGSGKSSIAEAAELALCGKSERSGYHAWRDGLQNLHRDGATETEVVLRQGGEQVRLGCRLPSDDVASAEQWSERGRTGVAREDLGWGDAVVRYRPVLTYGELSTLATTAPSQLYDPVNRILGLDGLTEADKRLTSAVTALGRPGKDAAALGKDVLAALGASPDGRASALALALSASPPDTARAREILSGQAADAGGRARLRAWAGLRGPDPDVAVAAAGRLTKALDGRARVAAGEAGRAERLANLLDLAIEHREHDDDRCPVCSVGVLDGAWLAKASEASAAHRRAAAEAEAAEREVAAARAAARAAAPPVPALLAGDGVGGIDPEPARRSWQALAALAAAAGPEADRGLADGIAAAAAEASRAAASLARDAAAVLDVQDEAWAPLAARAEELVRLQEEQAAALGPLAAATAARKWLRGVADEVREDRLAPFAAQISALWEQLRQESNVSLAGVRLAGTNTRRQVDLDLRVDGEQGSRSVLSQGELAALGLAVFLPRSAAQDSPFRFVIVDDPVQSLDPSKVDGLARVLHALAAERQVVVFTHDERLINALKRLALPCTALRVDRGERSVVTVEPARDPVDQHLEDADALAKDTVLPADLLAVAVTGYCRDALNEAAIEVARRRLLNAGSTVEDVERAVQAANAQTRNLLALALLGDRTRTGGPLNAALDSLGPRSRSTVKACVEGVHEPDAGAAAALLTDARDLVAALRAVT